ncbi:MarR family transcriptional regulator [Sedimentibacter sp. zth1]|uniref:metal-dependent transcriptional regulator n=1 Tax=Sedimentibacter sp. zth1 TaxID=2816908 RepID=UPI001A93A185|nr:iron dependent repressor, metal binding and dimerization domain protein [Sedimentibacter sp. zth1]QSX05947.1 MarR family transcriptional regulator [Sedimentibacter sp. zth1]
MNNNFYTFSEYLKNDNKVLTPSMEDYVEMIYRMSIENQNNGIRVSDLSSALNVKPPSTTKMIKRLYELDICKYKKHEAIVLTKNGVNLGEYLLDRHNIVNFFLEKLGVEKTLFEQTEKIEHVINSETLECIKMYLQNNI